MPRYVIADLQADGHHARWVRWICEAEVMRRADIVVAGPRNLLQHVELAEVRNRLVPQEVTIDCAMEALLNSAKFGQLAKKQLVARRMYGEVLHHAKEGGPVDLMFVPYVDHMLDAWAVFGTSFGNTPWVGLSMLPVFHLPKVSGLVAPQRRDDWIRERLFRKLLRNRGLRKLFTIDPVMLDYSRNMARSERERLCYLPDPSVQYQLFDRTSSRAKLNIPPHSYLVLLYGAISLRKGISQLISAVGSPECPRRVHVLLAGCQDRAARDVLAGPIASMLKAQGRLHLLDSYLDDHKERLVLSAADAMWIGYSQFYRMSGILVLAVRHGLPSIFTREGIIGHIGRKYKLGVEIDPVSNEDATRALSNLASEPEKYRASIADAQPEFSRHSIEHVQSLISAVLSSI